MKYNSMSPMKIRNYELVISGVECTITNDRISGSG